jgi:hypothetical protein
MNGWQRMIRDPSLPHQIVIAMLPDTHLIYVSCNCRRGTDILGRASGHEPLESRTRWEPGKILAVYRAHLAGTP